MNQLLSVEPQEEATCMLLLSGSERREMKEGRREGRVHQLTLKRISKSQTGQGECQSEAAS